MPFSFLLFLVSLTQHAYGIMDSPDSVVATTITNPLPASYQRSLSSNTFRMLTDDRRIRAVSPQRRGRWVLGRQTGRADPAGFILMRRVVLCLGKILDFRRVRNTWFLRREPVQPIDEVTKSGPITPPSSVIYHHHGVAHCV
jgi:hypothetical protein